MMLVAVTSQRFVEIADFERRQHRKNMFVDAHMQGSEGFTNVFGTTFFAFDGVHDIPATTVTLLALWTNYAILTVVTQGVM